MRESQLNICSILEKALKVRRAYTKTSMHYKKTIEEVKKEIEENFKDLINLKIKDNEVLQNDIPLYKKNKKEDNIFFPLYRDGLRELSIDPNISEEELEKFIEALNYDILKEKSEMDTVGFLWSLDLESINYKAVDGISETGEEGEQKGDEISKAVNELVENLKEKPPLLEEEEKKYKMVIDKDIKIDKIYVENKRGEKVSFEELPLIFYLEEKEIDWVKEEVLKVEKEESKIIFKFIKILLYCIKNENLDKETLDFYIEGILKGFLSSKDFSNFFWLLQELENFKEKISFNNFISFLNLEVLKEVLKDEKKDDYTKFLSHLLLLYLPELFLEFFKILPKESFEKFKEHLMYELNKNPFALDIYLKDEDKTFFILDLIPNDLIFLYLDKIKNFLNSKDEVLKEKVLNLLLPFLKYIGYKSFIPLLKSDNLNIRIKVLKKFEMEDLKGYKKEFLDFIKPENFSKLTIFEKKGYLKIILKNFQEEAIQINNLLPKRKLFLGKKEKKGAKEIANILNQFEEGKEFLKRYEKLWKKYLKGE